MPSASAKLEKQASTEAPDFVKQVQNMVEKKVRNLEKRKSKLDNYRAESANGKELNEDQLKAVSKYDQVVEMLEFSKDLQKSIGTISQDCVKQQKRIAKREQIERQQQEMQKIREILLLQDLLNNMGADDVRQDFLKGTNRAIKLLESDLDQLDGLYKLVSVSRETEETTAEAKESFSDQLLTAAEHLCLLLDGKNKEILGTTYKNLKEILNKINVSGYFDPEEVKEVEEVVKVEEAAPPPVVQEERVEEFVPQENQAISPLEQNPQGTNSGYFVAASKTSAMVGTPPNLVPHFPASGIQPPVLPTQPQAPLQDVLIQPRGSFNFLQESQVDLESPHMDPAVVVAHPMAPPPPMGFHPGQPEVSMMVVPPPTGVAGQTPQAPDFDPARPIPTQTFTNQNFAALQSIIPVAPPAGFVAPQAISVPSQVSSTTELAPTLNAFPQKQISVGNNVSSQQDPSSAPVGQYHSSDDNEEGGEGVGNSGQNSYNRGRGGRGGRGPRGPSNGYQRGPRGGNYSNGRGNYQGNNNYYNSSRDSSAKDRDNNYSNSSNQRRPMGNRGPRRGTPNRGGNNYRSQE